MWPYVTPQPRKIRHTAPAFCLEYPSVLKAYLSTTQPRKQEQAVSADNTLTSEHARGENLFSNLDTLSLQSLEILRGESRFTGSTLALVRAAQWLTTEKQHVEADSKEQEDTSNTASSPLQPLHKLDNKELYWQKIPLWQDVAEEKFQEHKWQVSILS